MISATKHLVLLTLSVMLITSCEEVVKKEKPLDKFDWLEGEWTGTAGDVVMQESWKKVNDDLFTAHAFVLAGTDTVFQEKVRLRNLNDTVYYIVFIEGVPDSTSFMLTKFDKGEAVFENPEHDFPQKIVYKKSGEDSLYATVEGLVGGVMKKDAYPYRKISGPPKEKGTN